MPVTLGLIVDDLSKLHHFYEQASLLLAGIRQTLVKPASILQRFRHIGSRDRLQNRRAVRWSAHCEIMPCSEVGS